MTSKQLRTRPWISSGLVLLLVVLVNCSDERPPATTGAEEAQATAFVGPGYAGVEVCAECHAERVASYRETAHFQTLRRPDPKVFGDRIAAIGGRLATRDPKLEYDVARVDEQVLLSARQALGDKTRQRREEIAFIMGSGRIFEGYLAWQGDRLTQLPIGYFGDGKTWSNCPGYPDGEAVFDREILPRCLDCHGTWAESRGGARYDPESIMPGLSCERCHGPGKEHVLHHRAVPDDDEGRFIVRPAILDRERRLDLCAQCHAEPGELIGEAFCYLPGTPLAAHVRQDGGHGSDVFVHTANQIQRLSSSRCFQGSATLDCLSCHKTHAPEGDSLFIRSRRACQSCHEDGHCGAAPDLPEGLRGDCLSCHMPSRQVSDTVINSATEDFLDFFRMTEHRIAIHPEATEKVRARFEIAAGEETLGRDRLARLADTLIARAAEKERAHRFVESMALLREAGRLDADRTPKRETLARLAGRERRSVEALVMLEEVRSLARRGDFSTARSRCDAVLALDPGQPEATVLRGELIRAAGGSVAEAEACFQEALQKRPDFADALLALATSLIDRDRPEQAIELTARILRDQPRIARAHLLSARALSARGDFPAALTALENYLAREPDDELARLNRAALMLETGRGEEALKTTELLALSGRSEVRAAAAQLLHRLGREGLERSIWEGLLDDPKDGRQARVGLARLDLERGDLEAARESLRPLIGRNDDAEVLALEAGIARAGNRFQEAQTLIAQALNAPGRNDQALLELMRLLASSRPRNLDAVLARADLVIGTEAGRDPAVLLEIAGLRLENGDRGIAASLLERARARPEFGLVPGLRERLRGLELRLDAQGGGH